MQEYVATVKKMDPSWNPQVGNRKPVFVFVKLTTVQLHMSFNCCMANFVLSRLKSKLILKLSFCYD